MLTKRDVAYARWLVFYLLVLSSQVVLLSYRPWQGVGLTVLEDDDAGVAEKSTMQTATKDNMDHDDESIVSYEKLFTTDSGTPFVPDVRAELARYYDMVLASMAPSIDAISAHQNRVTVKDMNLEKAVYRVGTQDLREKRLALIQRLHRLASMKREKESVCIATTIQHDAESLEYTVLPWIQYHIEMGVERFYILYDGDDVHAVEMLSHKALKDIVHIFLVKESLGAPDVMIQRFKFYDLTSRDKDVEGNKLLMKKQRFAVDQAIAQARSDGQSWIIQMDVDELFLPTGHDSITSMLHNIPSDVPAVRFMNLESQVEAGDVTAPFLQSNLFRVHMYFTTPEAHYFRGKFKQGLNTGFLYLYANGKSAARISDAWEVSQFGPHYFTGTKEHWQNPVSNDSFILHYCYTNPRELVEKAKRSCPQHYGKSVSYEVAKKDCFILDSDARAFMAANAGEADTFFYQNFVYSEGAPVQCSHDENNTDGWCSLSDIGALKEMLLRIGLFKRFTLPQYILGKHEIELSLH